MWNDLNRRPQILAFTLLAQDFAIDFTSGDIRVFIEIDVNKTLIMPQIKIRLGSIICDKHFSMLVRAHGAGINVDIGVKLLNRNLETAILQKPAQASCHNPFPDRRNYTAGDKNIFS